MRHFLLFPVPISNYYGAFDGLSSYHHEMKQSNRSRHNMIKYYLMGQSDSMIINLREDNTNLYEVIYAFCECGTFKP